MTKAEAKKLGWKFSGSKNDATAEKGRLIHMGPLNFVLKLIEKLEKQSQWVDPYWKTQRVPLRECGTL